MYSWYSSLLNAIGGRFSAAPTELGEDSELYVFFHSLNVEGSAETQDAGSEQEQQQEQSGEGGADQDLSSSSSSSEAGPVDRFRLEWVISHGEFSQLLKADHKWAAGYFKHPSVVLQLLSFVVNPPDAQAQLSKNASSILTGTNNCSKSARAVLFEDATKYLDVLFGPWIHPQPDPASPLPRLFATTVATVVLQLIQYSPEQMVEYFQQRWIAREDLAKAGEPYILIHELLELPGLLGSLFRFDDPPSYRDWLVSSEIISLLVDVFSGAPVPEEEAINQAAEVLEQISSTGYTDSLDLDALFQNAFLKNNTDTATTAQINALAILTKYARSLKSSSFGSTKLENLRPPLSTIAKNLPHLIDILKDNTDPIVNTTAGALRPLGMKRLRILELVEAIIETQNKGTHDLILSLNGFSHLLDLCADYKWNSILQSKVLEIFRIAFQPFDWPVKLIEEVKVHEKVAQLFADHSNPDGVSVINRNLFVELLDIIDRFASNHSTDLEKTLNDHENWSKMKEALAKFMGDDEGDSSMSNEWGNLNDSVEHLPHPPLSTPIVVHESSSLIDDDDEVILHDDIEEIDGDEIIVSSPAPVSDDAENVSPVSPAPEEAKENDAPADLAAPVVAPAAALEDDAKEDYAISPVPAAVIVAEEEEATPAPASVSDDADQ
eukprot:TRINITY_DN3079_c0_g1_i1.p1 TRINITY_DN3079_c0_g1~~TRINITY_DN3079_c0_g1_i1.p1  ORF type:complete len:743 (+),score=380.16 TRINITY_DN3079_c0_g1_i1:238-2229(+)